MGTKSLKGTTEAIIKTSSCPVAVVTVEPGSLTSPESRHEFLTHSIVPGVILRLLYDKRESLIKLGRKIKSLSGRRRKRKKKRNRSDRGGENLRTKVVGRVKGRCQGKETIKTLPEKIDQARKAEREQRSNLSGRTSRYKSCHYEDKSFPNPVSDQFQHESILQGIYFSTKQ